MFIKKLSLVSFVLAVATPLFGLTIRVPVVGFIGADVDGGPEVPHWFTETRVWNPGSATATVTVAGALGAAALVGQAFSIPAGGSVDLRYYDILQNSP